MKRKVRSILSVILVLVMLLGCTVAAKADELAIEEIPVAEEGTEIAEELSKEGVESDDRLDTAGTLGLVPSYCDDGGEHACVVQFTEDATCTENGHRVGYTCTKCGRHYSDRYGMNEISEENWIYPALGHDMTKTNGVLPTCETTGIRDYYTCNRCGNFYSDANGENQLAENEWIYGPHLYGENDICLICGRYDAATVAIRYTGTEITGAYGNLTDACAEAETGDRIVVVNDIANVGTIRIGDTNHKGARTFTIDVNGHTITTTGTSSTFAIYDDVTLTGGGTIISQMAGNVSGGINPYSITTIDGVNVVYRGELHGDVIRVPKNGTLRLISGTISTNMSYDGAVYVIQGGTFEMYGGTVENLSSHADSYDSVGIYNKGTVRIYGGTVTTNGYSALYVDAADDYDTVVAGGTLVGDKTINVNKGNVSVDGGTMNGQVTAVKSVTTTANVNITGGTFSVSAADKSATLTGTTANLHVKGGSYLGYDPQNYLSAGYTSKLNAGYYTVKSSFGAGHTHTMVRTAAKEPTCLEAGNTLYYTCTACGRYYSDMAGQNEIEENSWVRRAIGHTLSRTFEVAATCEHEGNNSYYTCLNCGHYYSDPAGTVEITEGSWITPVANHKMVATAASEPNCVSDGNSRYYTCSVCGKYFSDYAGNNEISEGSWVIPSNGHNYTKVEANAPTCTLDGNSAYYVCAGCNTYSRDAAGNNKIQANSWIIPATGHALIHIPESQPTCEMSGWSEYYTCDTCGKYFSDSTAAVEIGEDSWNIPASQHNCSYVRGNAATCETAGTISYYECLTCGRKFTNRYATNELTDEMIVISPLGHSLSYHAAVAPTYTNPGNTAYYECRRCGKYYSDSAANNEIAAGSWNLPARSHEIVKVDAVAPTCTESGNIEYYYCYDCDSYFMDSAAIYGVSGDALSIPPTGHTFVRTPGKDATCTEGGRFGYYTCTVCGKYYDDANGEYEIAIDSWNTDPLGHNFRRTLAKNPTCVMSGNTEYYSCTRCGKYYADSAATVEIAAGSWVIPANGHDMTMTPEVKANCYMGGNTAYYTCDACGKYYSDAEGMHEIQEGSWILPITSHYLTATNTKAVSCTEDGNSKYFTCNYCGKYFSDTRGKNEIAEGSWVIPATGHRIYHFSAQEPSCEVGGLIEHYYCSRCNVYATDSEITNVIPNYSYYIEPLGHNPHFVEAVEPTCDTNGHIAYYECENCRNRYRDEACESIVYDYLTVIPATGHSYREIAAINPTCESEGVKVHYVCDKCGNTYKSTLGGAPATDEDLATPALGHSMTYVAGTAPTCLTAGSHDYYRCNRCNNLFEDRHGEIPLGSTLIPAKGHSISYVGIIGVTPVYECSDCHKTFSDSEGQNEVDPKDLVVTVPSHSLTLVPSVEATCETPGNTAYYVCDTCGKYYADDDAANEISEGSWVVAAKGHSVSAINEVAPTCETAGNTEYYVCADCGKYFANAACTDEIEENSWILSSTGHALTKTNAVSATCTESGNSAYYTCDTCGKYYSDVNAANEISKNSWIITATGHVNTSKVGVVAAGLTTEGYTGDTVCSDCGTVLEKGKVTPATETPVGKFVRRLYNVCLDRNPDTAGYNNWVSKLSNNQATGVEAAYGFIFSTEFKNKNLCNADFINYLYKAIFGRNVDSTGLTTWKNYLAAGHSRLDVFNEIATSAEFGGLCSSYGITRGNAVTGSSRDAIQAGVCAECGSESGVVTFVKRLYSICLNRNADAAGLRNWVIQLVNKEITGTSCAYGFFFSAEFVNKKYSNSDYITFLYKAILGRNPDTAGKNSWVAALAAGTSRADVFYGFANSAEFKNICNSYGIAR